MASEMTSEEIRAFLLDGTRTAMLATARADQAEQFGRRNAVEGELLVRVHPQRTISRAGMTN